jgi:hypothetical protein
MNAFILSIQYIDEIIGFFRQFNAEKFGNRYPNRVRIG